ncbi:hypothetical protein OIO90_000528 [Microbotryomycetes sp. JL221]|nr:hypothetical protein OIO90_000528 [Microbotryomycetes sp. JL221]
MAGLVRPGSIRRAVSHLLIAGHNPVSPPLAYSSPSARQSPSNPSLTPVPFSHWLGAVGRAQDVDLECQLCSNSIASGYGHALLAYRNGLGEERVFAAGRNEAGQLGIGYASQEDTRGLVEGFRGDNILQAAAACQSSYLLLRRQDQNPALFVFGNLSRGRLGQPGYWPPAHVEDHHEPQLHMLARATQVPLDPELGAIKQIAVGFDHLLVLSESGEIWGTGCNTDGQLGLGPENLEDESALTKVALPEEIIKGDDKVERISAGADTSAFVTERGALYTWGNSEYAQALQGRKIDQIHSPTPIDNGFLSNGQRVVDFRCGGSSSLVLDNSGRVYAAGFGAIGQGKERLSSEVALPLQSLEGITRIRAGWGMAAAIQDDGNQSRLFTWGLNNVHGRLGIGALSHRRAGASEPGQLAVPMHVYEPREVQLPLRELGLNRGEGEWRLGEVEIGEQTMWVELLEGPSEGA